MQLQATGHAIRYRLKTGEEIFLQPGVPAEVPDRAAKELLMKAPDKVRAVESVTPDITIESATCRPVYWEIEPGIIQGPAQVSLMARMTDQFWLCVEYAGTWRWINTTLLRSKQAFQRQGQHACNCCEGSQFWESIHGAIVCSKCHPPANISVVKNWL